MFTLLLVTMVLRKALSRSGLRKPNFSPSRASWAVEKPGVVEGGVLLLQKPYSLETLARKVRQALAV